MALVGGNFTYSGDPAASSKDAVRFLMGDIDSRDPLTSDEEIDYLISRWGSLEIAAAEGLDIAITAGDRFVDKKVGDLQIRSAASRVESARERVAYLRRHSSPGSYTAYGGGVSVSDKKANTDDTATTRPFAWHGQFDHPGSGRTDHGLPASTDST